MHHYLQPQRLLMISGRPGDACRTLYTRLHTGSTPEERRCLSLPKSQCMHVATEPMKLSCHSIFAVYIVNHGLISIGSASTLSHSIDEDVGALG